MKKARFDLIYWVLNAFQTLIAPILLLKKRRRFAARGDAYEWDLKRWNPPQAQKSPVERPTGAQHGAPHDLPHGPHLVLVAMGFAETRLAARLSEMLRAARPDLPISWAIRNLEAARQGGAVPENQAVLPLPFDYFWPSQRWIGAYSPDAVVFIERFQFPVLARALHNRGVRVGAVAARTRDHRTKRYRVGAFYGRWLLGAFDLFCLRSEEEKLKLGDGIPTQLRVCVTGSLKFWPTLPPLEIERARDLENWLGRANNRPILAAGSTQIGDEEWVFEAFSPLHAEKNAVLLLAPRHVSRADEVEKLARNRGWKVARRTRPDQASDTSEAHHDPDVLLLDTLGELTLAYGAARAAFVGGTISGTGHNVLEPIAHGIPVFFGPKRGTFGAEQRLCEEAGVGFRVYSAQELENQWRRALSDPEFCAQVRRDSQILNEQGQKSWQQTTESLLAFLRSTDTDGTDTNETGIHEVATKAR